ncbi:universal stress protein [Roseovarius sp.]|uniref:universal stress protein n=1 Tax=Roseovarius sp. TaxID=1486281 RepID=UPI003D0D53A3
MSWKTIFCALSDMSRVEHTLTHAADLARLHGAHLDVLSLGVARDPATHYFSGAGASAIMVQNIFEGCHEEAAEIDSAARAVLGKQDGFFWSCDKGVAQLADLGHHVADRARFADLAVLPMPYGEGLGPELAPLTEAILFDGRIPAMVLPNAPDITLDPKRVVLAWNDGREALRAARDALPMLQRADRVHVVVVDPPVHGPNRSDPGGLVSQFLARHGVTVEVDVLSKTLPRVADVLLRRAQDIDADAIVMGAYGHSRVREAVFGGASRHMLEHAPLPLFMAH